MTLTIYEQSRNLLLQEQISEEQIFDGLAPIGFEDCQTAYQTLNQLAPSDEAKLSLSQGLPHLLIALAETSKPDAMLVSFSQFVQNAQDSLSLFQDLAQHPRALEILIKIFSGSQFLTKILLRHPDYFDRLIEFRRIARPKPSQTLREQALAIIQPFLAESPNKEIITNALDELRRFQQRELLRIGACDLLGYFNLPTVTAQLSYLADSQAQACLTLAAHATHTSAEDFAVIGMGKLGGEELNYSSDIDLLFICTANPTSYIALGQQLIEGLARMSAEGFLYRVDMRLRPWGRDGPLVSSLEGYLGYLKKHARLWEKQALLKARLIAGNETLGHEFLRQAHPLLFQTDSEVVRAEVHRLKQRIEEQLRQRGQSWGEVKLGEGSIRDIEFVVQYLQLGHGGKNPELRTSNTLEALSKLSAAELLPVDKYRFLADGYVFLRTIENHLQLMHYQQTHVLPTDPEALAHLARRLGFQDDDNQQAGKKFVDRFEQHSTVIRAIYQQYLAQEEPAPDSEEAEETYPDIFPHLTRMHPSYASIFSDPDIEHHVRLMEKLTSKNPIIVEAIPGEDGDWQVTVIGYDYLGELSLICGLLFVYGFNIIDGHVFSYGPETENKSGKKKEKSTSSRYKLSRKFRRRIQPRAKKSSPRKIVDVFTVLPEREDVEEEIWKQYEADLTELIRRLQTSGLTEAQGRLAKKVATVYREGTTETPITLYPVDIEIDNESSRRHTVLYIDALDTLGFLYEFTNALALNNINIRRMTVASSGNRVCDILYVTDEHRRKITDPNKQRELRAATVLIKQFTNLLPRSPNPEVALLHFREFVTKLFTQPNWPDELTSLERPRVLEGLARLLGFSNFLWQDFLRMQYENLFPVVRDVEALEVHKSKEQLREELEIKLQQASPGPTRREILNNFKDREMFRIDMRRIQGYTKEFGQFANELTDLAEIIVESAHRLAAQELRGRYGLPRFKNGHLATLSICALGKAGGRELGFASDIELMFIFDGDGKTSGPRVINTFEFYNKLVREVVYIIDTQREGIFEIDLQLRPYGKAGSMAVSLESFRRYFGPEGDAWPYEQQALVRLRPIAGDEKLGKQVVELRDKFIYTEKPFDAESMQAMRERQIRHLVTAGTLNAKYSPGGLVDIEYLVQGLQITHGNKILNLRLPNTAQAMTTLNQADIIPTKDYRLLREAHIFLRRLINALRMVRGNAKDLTVPPADSEEFAFLARRLHYGNDLNRLKEDLDHHMLNVQEINQKLLV